MSLNDVLTLSEVSKILNIPTSTLRTRIQKNSINKKYFRKTEEGVYLFTKKYVEDEKKIS